MNFTYKAIALLLLANTSFLAAEDWKKYFTFERISLPEDVDPQIGGIDVLPDGNIIVAFHRGEIMTYDLLTKSWSTYAEGLHEPLGILVENQNSVLVMQRPELTRLRDSNKDGKADDFSTVYDDFGLSGNYHEFAFGPARDKDGNLFVALGTASNMAGIAQEIRGEWAEVGQLPKQSNMLDNATWSKRRSKTSRMYSRVAYRGWVMKIPSDGSPAIPYASGLRSPDGIGFDNSGRLLVTDNQGDWLGTSKVYHIEKGNHYGHVASLYWREDWDDSHPLDKSVDELDALRTPAAGLLPQSELANSPTQPIAIPQETFGPFAQQTIIGEMNQPTLVRFLVDDTITTATQGATIPFLDGADLGIGNHRLTFAQDGSLYVGKTHLSWPGSEGIVRIKAKDAISDAFIIQKIELTQKGFALSFSKPVDAKTLKTLSIKSHKYHYHKKYGSAKVDSSESKISQHLLSDDGLRLFVELTEIKKKYLYTFQMPQLLSDKGQTLLGDRAHYHVVDLAQGE